MAITPLARLTAERQTVNDLSNIITSLPEISSTKVRTGAYSYRLLSSTGAFGRAIGSRSTVRIGYWLNHVGIIAGKVVRMFILSTGTDLTDSPNLRVNWAEATSKLNIARPLNATEAETLLEADVPADLLANDSWIHLGLTAKLHDSLGFLTVRVNGVPVLQLTGDVRLAHWTGSAQALSTSFNQFYVAGRTSGVGTNVSGQAWNSSAYLDDLGVYSYDDELDAPVPLRRYFERIANGAGADAEWTPLASTNVSQIDDGAPNGGPNDGDTTYNKAEEPDLRDTFTKDSVTVPDGHRIVDIQPIVHCKGLDSGPQISVHLFDGSLYADSPDIIVPLDYTIPVGHAFTQTPDGSPLSESNVNALQIGYRSRGLFT